MPEARIGVEAAPLIQPISAVPGQLAQPSTAGGIGGLDLFRLGGDRIRNQPGDPVDILVAVVRHAEPHHYQPRRGHDHDVLP